MCGEKAKEVRTERKDKEKRIAKDACVNSSWLCRVQCLSRPRRFQVCSEEVEVGVHVRFWCAKSYNLTST